MRLAALIPLASLAAAEVTLSSTSIIATYTQTRTVMRVVTATRKAVVNSTSSMSSMATGYSSLSSVYANSTIVYSTAHPTASSTYTAVATGAAPRMNLDSAIALIVGGAAAMLVL